jgi:hypothetical protein
MVAGLLSLPSLVSEALTRSDHARHRAEHPKIRDALPDQALDHTGELLAEANPEIAQLGSARTAEPRNYGVIDIVRIWKS